MTCEHLICARCGGAVVEARCPACQLARAQTHHHSSSLNLPLIAAVVLALLLLALTIQFAH